MSLAFVLAGCGVRGSAWAQALQERADAELVALVDPDASKARRLSARIGSDARLYATLEPALAQADAAVLATPPQHHFAQVQACLQRGLHVLCEKPLVEDFAPAVELVRMAARADRLLMVGMNFRYLPASQYLRRAVREKKFGALGFGRLYYVRNRDGRRADLNKYPLTMEHPMLREQSIHHLDLLRYCYDRDIVRVCADTWNPPGSLYRHDSCVSALLEFADGARASYLGTWTAGWNGLEFSWRSDFQAGMILQRTQFGDIVEGRFDPDLGRRGARFKDRAEAETLHPVPLAGHRPFADDTHRLLDEFAACLATGAAPATSARDHLRSLAALAACAQAAATRAWVDTASLFRAHRAEDLWMAP